MGSVLVLLARGSSVSAFESASFRFPLGLRDELAAAARLEGRSLNAEVVMRLRRSLGERDGAPGAAASSRFPSDVGGTGGSTVPVRAVAAVAPRSPSVVCEHGRDPVICEAPACKAARRR